MTMGDARNSSCCSNPPQKQLSMASHRITMVVNMWVYVYIQICYSIPNCIPMLQAHTIQYHQTLPQCEGATYQ